jgi:hydroxypyruvate reductase
MMTDRASFLRELFDVAVAAASPARIVGASTLLAHAGPPDIPTAILALGKASVGMANALHAQWPGAQDAATLAVTPRGSDCTATTFEVLTASHPYPDAASAAAGKRALAFVAGLTPQQRLIVLLSGGGSALTTLPVAGVDYRTLSRLIRELMAAGAPIDELNCVRKHLGQVGGGRLALACPAQQIEVLAISDVPRDDPALIASGPFVPDATTLNDARLVLHRYAIALPPSVMAALTDPLNETPKPGDPAFDRVRVETVPSSIWIAEVERHLRQRGYGIDCLGGQVDGDAHAVAQLHAVRALDHAAAKRRVAIISGGEATTVVRGPGVGGSNAEVALRFAELAGGCTGIAALFCDSDGIDGATTAAGAIIGPATLARAAEHGLSPRQSLAASDSGTFFATLGDAVVKGPTGTNVNDVRIVLIN